MADRSGGGLHGGGSAVGGCPFCAVLSTEAPDGSSRGVPGGSLVERRSLSAVLRDGFPVADGHLLVVPVRHVARLGQLSPAESQALFVHVDEVVRRVSGDAAVDGVTVGVNDGAAAGQTVPHVHVHVIPRRFGDVVDPRGGVRHVIPQRARYW